jgi:DNA-binding response OmpR family regulator
VENCLVTSGWSVNKVQSGDIAVSRVRRERFDATVVVSSGGVMDVTETVLNLRDITQEMEIVVVNDAEDEEEAAAVGMVARSSPHTITVSLRELKELLRSSRTRKF